MSTCYEKNKWLAKNFKTNLHKKASYGNKYDMATDQELLLDR